jgi:alpha-1,3-rhamnosyl/mannosyltransferase
VTTISEFSKREILRYLPVSADRVHVTPLAASEVFGTPLGTQDLKSRLRRLLPGVGDFFLCVANTYPHKQLHIIVEAMARLPEPMRYPLVLVGKPRLGEPAFQSALDRTRLRGGLIRLPRVSPEDLRAIYQGTALFLFPSVYEGFGLPVLEAMASGAVVVTTREGAIPEVAGGTVRYFEAGQASDLAKQIEEALSWSPGRREAWAASARARAAGFTWRRTADLTVAAFEAALGMPAKKPADHG